MTLGPSTRTLVVKQTPRICQEPALWTSATVSLLHRASAGPGWRAAAAVLAKTSSASLGWQPPRPNETTVGGKRDPQSDQRLQKVSRCS